MSDKTYIGKRYKSMDSSPELLPYTGVVIIVGEDDNGNQIVYKAGDETGRVETITNPWGTQQIANDILARIKGYVYRPFDAGGAYVEPAAEIGDGITIGGIYSVLAYQDITFSTLSTSEASAPDENELEDEFGNYQSAAMRQIERRLATTRTSLTVANGKIEAEVVRASAAENTLSSRITQTADSIVSEVERAENEENALLSQITQQAEQIATRITSEQAQTQIKQTLNDISLSVSSGSDGSSISMTADGVSVSSSKVDLHVKALNVEGEITAGKLKVFGENTNQRSEMTATGLNVYNSANAQKIGLGWGSGTTEYPYLMLGQGTGYSGSGAGVIQKLGAGIWIGDAIIAQIGGNYPGGVSNVQDISGSYSQATGIFIDFNNDSIYKYVNGVPAEFGEAVFG